MVIYPKPLYANCTTLIYIIGCQHELGITPQNWKFTKIKRFNPLT